MNKDELKKFAVEARRDLLEKVSLKAEQYGITKEDQTLRFEEKYGELVINGRSYPMTIKNALKTMESKLNKVGYEQFIEEVAYTWFNRITAIRYMEVNGHLPERVNVLSSTSGKSEPDIIFFYETMSLDIKKDEIRNLLNEEETDQAYRKLFVAQCNALNKVMPFLFERIEDYTELLLPDYLLDQESVIRRITNEVSENNFYEIGEDGTKKNNVEILGWLYQYYMSEKKEKVGGLKNNAVKKEDLPVVTQLFTPKWIVQYMVQNSLGKLYDEKYEDNNLSKNWEYYLKHEENHHLYPEFDSLEELKIMDPACGSGHILLYAFDMLYDMYQAAGYPSRDIPQLILENNLYGLDIDKRAQQIANFTLLMKAVEKHPRILSRMNRKQGIIKTNVHEIVDADLSLSEEAIDYFTKNSLEKKTIREILEKFKNAKQYGSLIREIKIPFQKWIDKLRDFENVNKDLIEKAYISELRLKLLPILRQGQLLSSKYHVTITNPPYHSNYNEKLKKFLVKEYKDYKIDLYSCFMNRMHSFTGDNGYVSMVTPYSWMFIVSHKNLRKNLLDKSTISCLLQLNYSVFTGATVPTCTFVLHKQTKHPQGIYLRLNKTVGESLPTLIKESSLKEVSYKYLVSSENFKEFPDYRIAYWATDSVKSAFNNNQRLDKFAEPKVGLQTGNNDLFLRFWNEVSYSDIAFNCKSINESVNSEKKWFPYNKGGAHRKWYGNQFYVVNWYKDGQEIKNYKDERGKLKSRPQNTKYYFKEGLSWSDVNSQNFGVRYTPPGYIFDVKGSTLFTEDRIKLFIILGFLTSKVSSEMLELLNPTISFQTGDLKSLPIIFPETGELVYELVAENIEISKNDWESYETSWGFLAHPYFKYKDLSNVVKTLNSFWLDKNNDSINKLKQNEEELNEIYIDLYGLEDEISSKLDDKDVTIKRAKTKDSVKSFLSYFLGCTLGRYSIDNEGIAYAGGIFDEDKYNTFKPTKEGLVHITEDHYFENDIIVRLKEFLAVAFSKETVDENMEWLAEALTTRKNESPEDRLRRYFMDEFFKDHCKTYQKRPIYWLVDSGKQKGLRTLIYMHRYQPDTMATIRFEHLQEIQSKYQNEVEMLEIRLSSPDISASDRKNLEKAKESYQKKIEELQEFDKKLAVYANNPIDIDLDDGVKVNHAKFEDVLAKIK
jgi:hypothetical protein